MSSRPVSAPRWDHDGRRAARLDVVMKASIRPSGSTKFDVDVVDMSVVGFRLNTPAILSPGDRIWLTVPGKGGLESIVMWRDNYLYGCAFVTPLHIAVFDHILERFRKPADAG